MAAFSATLICLVSLLSRAIATIAGGRFIVETQPKIHMVTTNLSHPERSDVDRRQIARTSRDLLHSVLPKDCGRRFLTGGRISGGYTAQLGEFPSFVRVDILVKSPTRSYINSCGGTLISDRHVLTVAHCFRHTTAGVQVYTTIDRRKPNEGDRVSLMYPADKLCVSPKYIFNAKIDRIHHDMALVRLARPVKFSRNVQPACLPGRPSGGKDKLREVGLGYTWISPSSKKDVRIPEQLQALPVKWITCKHERNRHFAKFCVEPKDPRYVGASCAGDSGSPVYGFENRQMVVVGITSYGDTRCQQNLASSNVKTDVYATRDELAQLMKECQ